MNSAEIIKRIRESTNQGARFASFVYRSKYSEETSLFTVLLGVNLERAYKRDLQVASHLQPRSLLELSVRNEIVESLKNSLALGIGNNPKFTQRGLYQPISKGVRLNKSTGYLHLWGFLIRKVVIEEGRPKSYPNEKTRVRELMRGNLRSAKFRDFILSPENISGVKMNGGLLEFHR